MHKVLKFTSILLGTLILFIILGIICLALFVSPNRLKPFLTEQVMKYTGRQLVIDGDMSWTFFPHLGVKVGHSSLGNPSGFNNKTFAEVSNITLGVKLMPLFHKRIESNGMILDGMKLHLIKNKDGKVNWDFKTAAVTPRNASGTVKTTTVSGKRAAMGLAVSGLEVTNTAIDYLDEQTQKYYDIKNFELHAKDINLTKAFPIQSAFDFTVNNPAVSGHAALKGDAALNAAAEIYSFRQLEFSANIKQADKKINLNISGDVVANLNEQTLQWKNFKSKVANVSMTGDLTVTKLKTNPVTKGNVQLAPFDLKETLQGIGENVSDLQTAKMVKGNVDFTIDTNGLNAEGNFNIDTLQASNVTLTNVDTKAHFQKGILDLAPMSANLYQGTLAAQTIINLNSAAPEITSHMKLTNVQAQPLMEDLGGKDEKIKIGGTANFEMQLTTSGLEAKTIVQNLNGVSQFNFKEGTIIGVDLGYLVDSAYALAKRQSVTATNTNQTNFGTLTGTAMIRSGVINNNDLFSDTPRFSVRGAGTIDLVNKKIDYTLQTVVKQRSDAKDNLMNLYGITLPVVISGNLNDPTVRLDSAALVKSVGEQQIKKVTDQAKTKLQEQIKKQLPGKASDLFNGRVGNVLDNVLGN
ncbi:MAG TPA: AsmA family protein [Gammaproteobacteria bacterium]|nr:AsmA family protein [Gammaproteobacteria bacterium]